VSNTTLGELLAQMDGLESNDGVIVVATTNDLAAIEPALTERPSRFDVVLEIGLPQAAARRAILAQRLARQTPDAATLDLATEETTDLSGAQVREVAFLAIQRAILRDALQGGLARPDAADIRAAVEHVTGRRKRAAIGFQCAQ
jgi:SpoVK/Ycf46/Vps4 family AAA+-type ATPase